MSSEDSLPFKYVHPEKVVMWICDYDEDEKITSVFVNLQDKNERTIDYISLDDAKHIKSELVINNWDEFKDPEITFIDPNKIN